MPPRIVRALLLLALVLAGCAAPAATPPAVEPASAEGSGLLLPPQKLPDGENAYEPSVAVDDQGNVLVEATRPFRPAPVWASHDGGGTFARAETPDLPVGIEGQPAFSPDGDAYVIDDNAGTTVVMRSRDGGRTWEQRSVSAFAIPAGDRPWIAAGREGRVYVTWSQLTTGQWVAASEDGGATFPVQTIISPVFDVATGPIAVAPSGAVLIGRFEAEGVALHVSHDGARSFTRHLAWRGQAAPGIALAVPTTDDAGRVYVATIERMPEGTRARYAVSADGGVTFSAPRELTREPGVHVHAWADAGPDGRLAAAFYENPTSRGAPSDADGDWFLRVVVLDGAHTDAPTAREERVAAVHRGSVCTQGTPCSVPCMPPLPCVGRQQDGDLIDYLGVAMTPQGVAHVVYQDALDGIRVWHVRTKG